MKRESIFDIDSYTKRSQFLLDLGWDLVVDLFAGAGGVSEGIEMALHRHPDIALNHNEDALSLHAMNHPQTEHIIADVREICPRVATRERRVGLLHLSPDCRDHSQAKGGQPRDRKVRALSWVGVRWAGTVRPRVISLENVPQILRWGRLIAKRDPVTRRIVKIDGSVAAKGEHVPLREQFLVPDPKRVGQTWKRFVAILESMGYVVEWRVDRACFKGAATFRQRLWMFARCDGQPIVWPEDSHAVMPAAGQQALRPAWTALDFSIEGRSIFGRERPLAPATYRRIAVGVERFVLSSALPFILPRSSRYESGCQTTSILPDATGTSVLVPAASLDVGYMAQMNAGYFALRSVPGRDLRQPVSSITQKGSQQQLIALHLVHLRGNCDARSVEDCLHTISAGGQHHGLVTTYLASEQSLSAQEREGARRVVALLREHCVLPEGDPDDISGVIVKINGAHYAIVDIKLRLLTPRELFRCQSFPDDYVIDRGHDGREFSLTKQIQFCGNSVSPVWAAAFIRANLPELVVARADKSAWRSRHGTPKAQRLAA
ncbi:DNA cytosine methyltransferase [Paraburkholderia sp. J8-2]|uniref:DNA cytosine methyltransferase n=1 Tax=Paraburkholderia sp. J8-2 TaxID=2805440 RepID=UPI002AB5FD77|nr:DNA cytosine methyltransferase [Paraburkholderia sp. J8-2]